MLSYLTGFPRQQEASDVLSVSLYTLGALTIIHLTATYFVIKLILKRKHSESIRLAEDNQVSKFSVLGFRKLLLYLTLLCSCFIVKFMTHKKDMYDMEKTTSPPPVTVMSTVMAAVTCVYFVCSKQKIRAFMKRRVRGFFESLFPSMILSSRSRKIVPM